MMNIRCCDVCRSWILTFLEHPWAARQQSSWVARTDPEAQEPRLDSLLSLTCCVIWSKLLNSSVPSFLHACSTCRTDLWKWSHLSDTGDSQAQQLFPPLSPACSPLCLLWITSLSPLAGRSVLSLHPLILPRKAPRSSLKPTFDFLPIAFLWLLQSHLQLRSPALENDTVFWNFPRSVHIRCVFAWMCLHVSEHPCTSMYI